MGDGGPVDFALYQLRSFENVARLGSISKAARSLGYSQSTVTAHIRVLEKQLGVRLFQRLPHGVRLTDSGETFRVYVTRLLSIVADMTAALGAEGATSGRLTIGVPAILVDQVVGPLVQECQLRHPDLLLTPRTLAAVDIPAALFSGDIDLGFVLTASDDPACHDELWGRSNELGSRVVAPVDFLAVGRSEQVAVGGARPAGRAADVRLLLVDGTCPSQHALVDLVERQRGTPAVTVETGSVEAAREIARCGSGIAMLPATAAQRDDLAEVSWLPAVRMHARLVWPASTTLSPAAQSVVGLATGLVGALDRVAS
jgi:DNA-binding transcriptional LysR family regulator